MPLDLSGKGFSFPKNKSQEDGYYEPCEKVDSKSDSMPWITSSPKYKLSDLILDETTRGALLDATAIYAHQEKLMNEWGLYERFSDRANISINLYGEPGTGKTMAAHAIANELNKEILFVDSKQDNTQVGEN